MRWGPNAGCQDSSPTATGAYGKANRGTYENNVAASRAAGHPIPPLEEWWVEHPDADALKKSLRAPYRQDEGICVRRLWFPEQIIPRQNVDDALMQRIAKNPKGPQQLALASHYVAATGDMAKADELMAAARAAFWVDPWKAYVYCGSRVDNSMAAVLAFDWIQWQDVAEFDQAFQRVRALVDKELELTSEGWPPATSPTTGTGMPRIPFIPPSS